MKWSGDQVWFIPTQGEVRFLPPLPCESSSAAERLPYTRYVAGSIPASRTARPSVVAHATKVGMAASTRTLLIYCYSREGRGFASRALKYAAFERAVTALNAHGIEVYYDE